MRRLVRALLLLLIVSLAVAGIGWFVVQRALNHEPAFYARAMTQSPEVQDAAGIELEKEVLDLHNQVRRAGHWQASFAENELNGWLAVDLPVKFPKLLPEEAADPRLALRDGEALIACRYQSDRLDCVVSIALGLRLTANQNEIAIRVRRARAGALPLPLSKLIDQASHAARREGIRLRWTEEGGEPVALVRVSPKHPEFPDRTVTIETLDIEGGQLLLGGVVEEKDARGSRIASRLDLSSLRLPLEYASTLILR